MINLLTLGRQTSGYGPRNTGIPGASRYHRGVDIVLNDRNIPAVVGGTVVVNSYNSARGNYITIKDNAGYLHTYQHMASKSSLAVGSTVKEGGKVGVMGNTGVGSGAHLHYEVKNADGNYINPIEYLKKGGKGAVDTSTYPDAAGSTAGQAATTTGTGAGIAQNILTGGLVILVVVVGFIMLTKAFDLKL